MPSLQLSGQLGRSRQLTLESVAGLAQYVCIRDDNVLESHHARVRAPLSHIYFLFAKYDPLSIRVQNETCHALRGCSLGIGHSKYKLSTQLVYVPADSQTNWHVQRSFSAVSRSDGRLTSCGKGQRQHLRHVAVNLPHLAPVEYPMISFLLRFGFNSSDVRPSTGLGLRSSERPFLPRL